jgi:hypothetical protein
MNERDGAGANLLAAIGPSIALPTGGALRNQRYDYAYTTLNAGTLFISSNITFNFSNLAVIDATVRFGLAQLVRIAAPASSIPTTGAAAVTRAADVLSLAIANRTYTVEVRRLSGLVIMPGQVVSGGAWLVPVDPSPLRSVTFI